MDSTQNPFSILSIPELINRALNLLRWPLAYYMEYQMELKLGQEAAQELIKKLMRGKPSFDVPLLLHTYLEHSDLFEELKSFRDAFYHVKKVRNLWAHYETVSEFDLVRFFYSCEGILNAVVSPDYLACYDQIKALRQYLIVNLARDIQTAWTETGPPTILPAETVLQNAGIDASKLQSNIGKPAQGQAHGHQTPQSHYNYNAQSGQNQHYNTTSHPQYQQHNPPYQQHNPQYQQQQHNPQYQHHNSSQYQQQNRSDNYDPNYRP